MDIGLGNVSSFRLSKELSLRKCDTLQENHPVLTQKLPLNKIMEKSLSLSQGIHAPLRLKMEHKFAGQVGRLSCLPSSNFQRDVLTGADEEMDFSDLCCSDKEWMTSPHSVHSSEKF